MPALTVKVVGLEELQKKLQPSYLYEPEIEAALDTVAKRGQRGGRGLGAKLNPISVEKRRLSRSVISPLARPSGSTRTRGARGTGTPRPRWMQRAGYNPRRKGTSWLRKNLGATWTTGTAKGVLGATAINALKKAAQKILARWSK